MNKHFLNKAKELKPQLTRTKVSASGAYGIPMSDGDAQIFDFGNHYVGYVSIKFSSSGSHQDAPALIKLKFCEIKDELDEDTSDYKGWISKGWFQEEYIHVDTLPKTVNLKRRYAFRYVKIEVIAVSSKYNLVVDNVSAVTVTSATELVEPVGSNDRERNIDKVALRTLSECMQYEFEDGPKRDQRLWLGDLRLQALANYETFKQNDLVKRCLYLFAGTADKDGRLSGCIFTKPKVEADDTFMFDYSLLFIPTLLDYTEATGHLGTAEELLPIALKQLELAQNQFDSNHVIVDSDKLGWCFLDWSLELNKQAGAQAVYIYAARAAVRLLKLLGKDSSKIEADIKQKADAAVKAFFDEKIGLFVSGKDKQISYAANVWFVLAEVFEKDKNAKILSNLEDVGNIIKPVTPYMYHHYIQALIDSGLKDKALTVMCNYWGGMVDMGANTFFELYNPENPDESPYASKAINSYCHAWSCTPSYFLRKYFK